MHTLTRFQPKCMRKKAFIFWVKYLRKLIFESLFNLRTVWGKLAFNQAFDYWQLMKGCEENGLEWENVEVAFGSCHTKSRVWQKQSALRLFFSQTRSPLIFYLYNILIVGLGEQYEGWSCPKNSCKKFWRFYPHMSKQNQCPPQTIKLSLIKSSYWHQNSWKYRWLWFFFNYSWWTPGKCFPHRAYLLYVYSNEVACLWSKTQ